MAKEYIDFMSDAIRKVPKPDLTKAVHPSAQKIVKVTGQEIRNLAKNTGRGITNIAKAGSGIARLGAIAGTAKGIILMKALKPSVAGEGSDQVSQEMFDNQRKREQEAKNMVKWLKEDPVEKIRQAMKDLKK